MQIYQSGTLHCAGAWVVVVAKACYYMSCYLNASTDIDSPFHIIYLLHLLH